MSKSNLSKKISRNKSVKSTKKTAKPGKAQINPFFDVDRSISSMARKGQLSYSGENAVRRSLKNGLSITVAEDGAIYKVHPNGTKTRVKRQQQIYRDSKTGRFYKK